MDLLNQKFQPLLLALFQGGFHMPDILLFLPAFLSTHMPQSIPMPGSKKLFSQSKAATCVAKPFSAHKK